MDSTSSRFTHVTRPFLSLGKWHPVPSLWTRPKPPSTQRIPEAQEAISRTFAEVSGPGSHRKAMCRILHYSAKKGLDLGRGWSYCEGGLKGSFLSLLGRRKIVKFLY